MSRANENANAESVERFDPPSFRQALRFWIKLGFISFGGPSGQIAIMHQELVERRKWISESRFLHALNYCMLLPGPEAQQLAIYVGWLLHRTWGGIAAGSLFVLPSVFILGLLSYFYVAYGHVTWVASMFYGLKPVVTAIVAAAVIRIGQRALKNEVMWSVAACAFVAIYFFQVPFPIIIISAAVVGLVGGHFWKSKFLIIQGHGPAAGGQAGGVLGDTAPSRSFARPSLARAVRVLVVGLLAWWIPIVGAGLWLGWEHTIFEEGLFFSKAAMVTFGGAYAVLPYVSQEAVANYGWLEPGQMLDGLGLAETTPGPLIMVVQFVGFIGAWTAPGALPPLKAAIMGALITTWATFVPCFLWIFLGAPYIEQLRGNERVSTALSAVTAAVVGVILNLAVWFGLHVLFPAKPGVDWFAVALAIGGFIALVKFKWNIVPVILAGALLGLVFHLG